MHDKYRDTNFQAGESRQLDHVVSAHEVHNDPGRVLAGLDGAKLANQESNLSSTHGYLNNLKKDHSMEEFVNRIVPKQIAAKKASIQKNQEKLESLPADTPKQRHEKQKLQDKINKEKEHLKALEEFDGKGAMEADKKARQAMDQQINKEYYTSSKFFKETAVASAKKGALMGARQALGLVLAEIWFELIERIPEIFRYCTQKAAFEFEVFLEKIKTTFTNIVERVKVRFRDLLTSFADGVIGGILASITTTILNTFFTSQKLIVKLIRESWNSLVKAAKILFFNPEDLRAGDLTREVIRILGSGAAIAVGTILNGHLEQMLKLPFGSSIAAFISAMATGILTLGLTYYLDHSAVMQKVWDFLNALKSKYEKLLDSVQAANAKLDRYLTELSKLEFQMNPDELAAFASALATTNSEIERSLVLRKEIQRRNIKLPFESGNHSSVRSWLKSKQQ
ncbi:DNA repair protein [Moraxella caviae]|uniref:DNA repair protein n=1 Tax=Moraxella caviae TaxID=34060 RepID=UPI001B80B513|nr:DNA repair protein [Moraxella caviae]